MRMFFCSLGAIVIGIVLWCCKPLESYTDVLEVSFESLSFADITSALGTEKRAVLVFSFADGNGNLGVRTFNDSISKIHYTWYQKLPDGKYEAYQFISGTITDSIAIPYRSVMDRDEAQNRLLKGKIEIALSMPINPQNVDTMRIEYFIFDRSGKQSNVDHTPDFSILDTSITIKK